MDNNIIGERILELLTRMRMSQKDLSVKTGLTEVSISRYIKGSRVPNGYTIVEIAKALHTTTDYLLGYSNNLLSNEPFDAFIITKTLINDNKKEWSRTDKFNLLNALMFK